MNFLREYWMEGALFAIIAGLFHLFRLHRKSVQRVPEPVPQEDAPRMAGLERRLRYAGFSPARTLLFFRILRVLLAIFAALWAMNWIEDWLLIVPFGAVGYLVPDLWLRSRIRRRQKAIRKGLSFFVDLITSLSRAGLTLEKTFVVAAREGFPPSHPLAVEVGLLGRELKFGRERDSAFQLLAERSGVIEMKALASSIRMGMRSGSPIEDSLESQADFLRFRRQEEAARDLSRAVAAAMVPIFLSGVPLWAVVVYFPMVLEILETIKNLNPF